MKTHSIRTKIIFSIIILALVISTVLVYISYITYKSVMNEHYETLGNNVAKTAVAMLDEDVMLKYSKQVATADPQTTMESQEYQDILGILDRIKASNNVLYLYMIYPTETGAYFVFDTDKSEESCPYGYFMEYYEGSFSEISDKLVRGEAVPAVVSDQDYGWIISISYPYLSQDGELVGYMCVDLSMDKVVADRQSFLFNCIWIMLLITVAFTIVYMVLFNRIFVRPIIQMTNATGAFVSNRENGEEQISLISSLEVHTNDELQKLCESLKKMKSDLNLHIENLKNVTAEKERIGAELNVATHIQKSMLPRIFPAFPEREEFDVYATMDPAKEVGGDFYDFFLVDEDHLALVIADVSGKGVPAALFMVIAKTIIKNHAQNREGPAQTFIHANEQLCEGNDAGLFVTTWMGVLEISTGKFIYVNAGHNPPLLKRAGGEYAWLNSRPGFVLAGMEGMRYQENVLELAPGDQLYLYTDGVTEATNRDNELFGEERLLAALNEEPGLSVYELLPKIKKRIDDFAGDAEQFDDITMLGLTYRGKGGSAQ